MEGEGGVWGVGGGVRLPGKGDSNSHGARPDHLIITMIKWIRTSRLSIKTLSHLVTDEVVEADARSRVEDLPPEKEFFINNLGSLLGVTGHLFGAT